MSERTCAVPGCARPHAAKGYCHLHWNRWRIHGDPLITMKGKAHKVKHTEDGLRVCKKCGEPQPLSAYHRDKKASDGYRAQCKACRNSYMAGYYVANREARVAYEQDRRTNQAEHMRALDMARYERSKDKRIALASEFVRLRRARLAGAKSDRGVTIMSLRARDGDNCCYCGVALDFRRGKRGDGIAPNRATLEHVLPLSRGGSHTFDNTKLACHCCNTSKNDKTVDEWLDWKAGGLRGRKEAAGAPADRVG